MSLQIKRKYLEDAIVDASKLEDSAVAKSKVAADAIDDTKIKLLAGASLRAVSRQNAANVVSLIQSDVINGQEVVKIHTPTGAQQAAVISDITTAVSNFKTSDHDPLNLRVTTLEGTGPNSVAGKIQAAIDDITDGAALAFDTLKKIQDYISVDGTDSVISAVEGAIAAASSSVVGGASANYNTLLKLENLVKGLQTELDATQTAAGLATNGSYSPHVAGNYIGSATSIHEAVISLDASLKSVQTAIATLTGGDLADVISNQSKIKTAVGLNSLYDYAPSTLPDTEVVQSATSVLSADQLLAKAVKSLAGATGQAVSSFGVASFVADASTEYLSAATSLPNALKLVDNQLKIIRSASTSQVGSIAKAEADAKAYADLQISKILGMDSNVVATFEGLAAAMADNSEATGVLQYMAGIRDEVDRIELGAGLDSTGQYVPLPASTYLTEATSLAGAIEALDTALNQVDINLGISEVAIGQLQADLEQEVSDREQDVIAAKAVMAGLIEAEADARVAETAELFGRQFRRKTIASLTASDIAQIVLDHKAMPDSIVIAVGRLMLHEGVDFNVDNAHLTVDGERSKITFTAELQGSDEALAVGDSLFIRYMNV